MSSSTSEVEKATDASAALQKLKPPPLHIIFFVIVSIFGFVFVLSPF